MTDSKEKATKKSLQESFNKGQRPSKAPAKRKRLPPLSVRVTEEERLQLKQDGWHAMWIYNKISNSIKIYVPVQNPVAQMDLILSDIRLN